MLSLWQCKPGKAYGVRSAMKMLKQILLLCLYLVCVIAFPQEVKVFTQQSQQKLHSVENDGVTYETKYEFVNSSSRPFTLLDRTFAVLLPTGEVIEEGKDPMKTEGVVPGNGRYEWTDFPYIAKRWADEGKRKNSDRIILRQFFRLRGRGKTINIHCDTVYLISPDKIAKVSLPPKISITRGTKQPLRVDARDEEGKPILPWAGLPISTEDASIAKVEGNDLVGLRVGWTVLSFAKDKFKAETKVEVLPALGDEKMLPPLLRLLPGEKRFLWVDNLPQDEVVGFVIRDKGIAERGEIVSSTQEWDPRSAYERDIKEVGEFIEGKKPGRTNIIVRGLKTGTKREGEIEVVEMREEPANHWRTALFIFKNTEVTVEGKEHKLSYKPEEIEGIKEASRRFREVVKYFTAGNLEMDVSLAVLENEKITNDIIEDTHVYGYRINMYKAQPLLERLSKELLGKPITYFDDIIVCSPLPKAGAAWGGWEFRINDAVIRALYIPNFWRDGTKIWGDMVEVMVHEWIHCLEGHVTRSGLKPIPSADGGAMEGEILSSWKDPTFRRPKGCKTWMPYYMHILRDFLSTEDWQRLQTSFKRESVK